MAKLTLNDVASGYQSNVAANTNNTLIETAIENTISRDGTAPNQMEADFDMNSYEIMNVGAPTAAASAARLGDISDSDATGAASAILRTELATAGAITGADLVAYLPSGTGAVDRVAQDKLREAVSVTDFGAVGDGVTDDTVAIQTAINAVSNGGGELHFPAGKYMTSGQLYLYYDAVNNPGFNANQQTSTISLIGANAAWNGLSTTSTATIITSSHATLPVMKMTDISGGLEYQHSCHIKNMTLIGTSNQYILDLLHFKKGSSIENVVIQQKSATGHGLRVDNAYLTTFKNMFILGASATFGSRSINGVYVDHSVIGGGQNSFENITSKGFQSGYKILATTGQTLTTSFYQCQANSCDVGLSSTEGTVLSYTDGYIESCEIGASLSSSDVTFSQNYIQAASVHGVIINSAATSTSANVVDNHINLDSATATAIAIEVAGNTQTHIIKGNAIVGANAGHTGIVLTGNMSRSHVYANTITGTYASAIDTSGVTASPATLHNLVNTTTVTNQVTGHKFAAVTLAAGATTIDLRGADIWRVTGDGGGNSVTTFTTVPGQIVVLQFTDALVTLVDGANLIMAGNCISNPNDTITFADYNGTHYEMCRSAN